MKIRSVPVAAASRGALTTLLLPEPQQSAVMGSGEAAKLAGPGLAAALDAAAASGDLKPAFRNMGLFHQPRGVGNRAPALLRLGVVGLGEAEKISTERLRRAAALAQQQAAELGAEAFSLVVADGALGRLQPLAAGQAIAEGLVLGSYRYEAPRQARKSAAKDVVCTVAVVGLAGAGQTGAGQKQFQQGLELGQIAAQATCFARDLENQPSNICTPAAMAQAARRLAGGRIRVKVLDQKAMARLGMNALLGVSRGSAEAPYLLVLEYRAPKAKGNVCVVGKGLTFDTGGISIKPAAKMDEMRYDMCGAGAVLGLFHALKHGGLAGHDCKHNVIGIIAAVENAIGPAAQKPGDVVRAMDGQTIEVLNTDAEGRLVLADAICYAKKFHAPKQIVDLATLTGAVVVALGHEMAGIMGNQQELVDALRAAGERSDEPLWQLPLWDCHRDQMKSKFADLQNINGPQFGNGSIAGAAFLSYFVGETPWAHLDIAGAAYGGIAKDYYKGGAAGTAVRTLLQWVRTL